MLNEISNSIFSTSAIQILKFNAITHTVCEKINYVIGENIHGYNTLYM